MLFLSALLAPGLALAAPARGQAPDPEGPYPVERSQRPLTLPAGRLRVDVDQTALGFSSTANVQEPFWSLSLGGAVGIGHGLELGVSAHREGPTPPSHSVYPAGAPSVMLAPYAEFGNVPLYVRGSLVRTHRVEAVLDIGALIPVQSDFALDFGMLIRIYAHPRLTIDVGGQYLFVLQSERTAGCPSEAACNEGSALSLWLPLTGTVQLGRLVYATIDTGIEMDNAYAERWAIPVAVRLGMTLPTRDDLLDVGLQASWPRLVRPFADDRTATDLWQLQLTLQANLGL